VRLDASRSDFTDMKIGLFSVLALLSASFSGCATGRSYHARESLWGLGYSETMVATDSWRVMYRGYSIPEAQAADYALLRASELMLSSGFPYFILLDERSSAPTQGVGMLSMQGGTGFGGMGSYSYPESNIAVKGLTERPNRSPSMVYESAFISAQIRSKYRIK
jgi:hypothetical protein